MSVLSLRRFALLLLAVVPMLSFRCAQPERGHAGWPPERRFKPVINVDEKALTASPRVAIVWDVEPADPNGSIPLQRSNRPVKVTWKTKDPNFKLLVRFVTPSCPIPQPECKESGKCTATIPAFSVPNPEPYRCTYELRNMSNVAQLDEDSDIVVMPCCM